MDEKTYNQTTGTGKTLNTGTLVYDPSRSQGTMLCAYTFTVDSLPTVAAYRITVLSYPAFPPYSFDDLQAAGWRVELSSRNS